MILVAWLLMILLTGCTRSEAFFAAHDQARAQMLQACGTRRAEDAECRNAAAAEAAKRHSDAEQIFREGINGAR